VSLLAHLFAGLVVTIGATLQGSIGFGLGLFSVPLLVLIDPKFVPGPLLFSSLALTVLLTHRERGSVLFADLKWAVGGRLLGIAAAAAALELVPARQIGILFGVLVLGAVGLSSSGWRLAVTPRSLFGAGILSGFMGTAVSIGGPPVALLYQHETGARIRGTLSAFFFIGVSMSLVGLHLIGRFGWPEVLIALSLVPGIVLGFVLSRRLVHLLDRGYVRRAVLLVSGISALAVLARSLL
jgi:uncharacterized membrane protein YfcA